MMSIGVFILGCVVFCLTFWAGMFWERYLDRTIRRPPASSSTDPPVEELDPPLDEFYCRYCRAAGGLVCECARLRHERAMRERSR
jgi:hypothetical protein